MLHVQQSNPHDCFSHILQINITCIKRRKLHTFSTVMNYSQSTTKSKFNVTLTAPQSTRLFFTHLTDKHHFHVIKKGELHTLGAAMNDKQTATKCKMECHLYSAAIRTIVFHSSYR